MGRTAALALGVLLLVSCSEGSPEDDACAELRASLHELECRFDGEAEQSWDDVQEATEASAKRDRLRAELADAGCAAESGG